MREECPIGPATQHRGEVAEGSHSNLLKLLTARNMKYNDNPTKQEANCTVGPDRLDTLSDIRQHLRQSQLAA